MTNGFRSRLAEVRHRMLASLDDAKHVTEAPGEELTGPARAAPPRPALSRDLVAAYYRLTKPRIVTLLLITTVPSMILADGGLPSLWRIVATLLGGTLAAGGANAVNQFVDRDIDEIMARTRKRPLPSHAIPPRDALTFGVALGVVGVVFLAVAVNALAAVLTALAFLFYVFVYTLWLKRRSPQNIVIGGAAGAAPTLVGWAAVTGSLDLPALVLFAIVFLWTPPHFWALSLRYHRDYHEAGIPMLPVVAGREATTRSIFLYSVLLVFTTLLLWPMTPTGVIYPIVALVLGGLFVFRSARLHLRPTVAAAMSLFRFSLFYLAALFAAVAVDTLVR